MKALKVLGIIELVLVGITFAAVYAGAEEAAIGTWALLSMGVAVALSIVSIVKAK